MAIEAVKAAIKKLNYPLGDIDLIVGATYTPHDTIGTIGYIVQKHFNISKVMTVTVSTACSSFVNAVEIAQAYFAANKASKALVVAADHNNIYSDEKNTISGHLFGDAAVAVFLAKEKIDKDDTEIIDIMTMGLGNIGQGPNGVVLQPQNGGLKMPFGKDVFMHACNYMADMTKTILAKNNYSIDDLDYLIPHQANIRIINKVADKLQISRERVIVNIDKYGNTGSASAAIGLSQHIDRMRRDSLVAISVFGGGYSAGSMLIKR
jgi:3-oxoacyl-[acyl-carrier-protein] synthase-3